MFVIVIHSVGAAKVWSEVNILREILKADGDYAR